MQSGSETRTSAVLLIDCEEDRSFGRYSSGCCERTKSGSGEGIPMGTAIDTNGLAD
jgi:hypothetical protein